jgi:hypothetical protein
MLNDAVPEAGAPIEDWNARWMELTRSMKRPV